ncbi:hypothetical protein NMG60_11035428 [Bertholletia excelsa]
MFYRKREFLSRSNKAASASPSPVSKDEEEARKSNLRKRSLRTRSNLRTDLKLYL